MLSYQTFIFEFRANGKYLPEADFLKNTYQWHGAFNEALSLFCVKHSRGNIPCEGCTCVNNEILPREIKETKNGLQASNLPRPFIVYPLGFTHNGRYKNIRVRVQLTLFGSALAHWHLYKTALVHAGWNLNNSAHPLLHLDSICTPHQTGDHLVYETEAGFMQQVRILKPEPKGTGTQKITLTFETPAVIQLKGGKAKKEYWIRHSALEELYVLIKARLEKMNALYGADKPYTGKLTPKFPGKLLPDTNTYKETPFPKFKSASHARTLQGKANYTKVPARYIPWLKIAEVLHVGNLTSLGLGKLTIHEA